VGIFSKKVAPAPYAITFGANFSNSISTAYQKKAQSITIDFPQNLMKEIDNAIGVHQATENVLYDDEMHFLDVVGEAQHQEDLLEILRADEADSKEWELEREGSDWYAGFLMPEPYNRFDPNAVKVLLINLSSEDEKFYIVQVGYLAREQAKKVHKKVIGLLDQGKVIPVLLKIIGGTAEKPSVGVVARAKTKSVKF
jgi:hypothetical protein